MSKTVGIVLSLKDKCSPQLQKIADKTGLTINQVKKLANQAERTAKQMKAGFKTAAAVTAGALGAIGTACGVLVNQTMEAGDRIDKMSQKIGMSRQAFQEWDYIMSQNGGSVETLQMGFKTLASQMGNALKGSKESTAAFNSLGVKITDSTGALKSQDKVFNEVIKKLQSIQNPTQKAILAQKLFGRSTVELKPLLNKSAESVDELRNKANELGMVMSDDAVNAAVKLTDTMDTVKRALGAAGLSIGAELLPVIQEMADKFIKELPQIKAAVIPVLTSIINVIKFLSEHIKGLTIMAGIMFGIFAGCTIINTAANAINILTNAINLAKAAGGAWNFIMMSSVTLQKAQYLGTLALTGATKAWAAAQAVCNAVMQANPIIKFITLALAAAGAVWALVKAFRAFRKENKNTNIKAPAVEKPKKHALGTTYSTGGAALVGEFGPEIVNLNKGDTVTTADKTRQLMTQKPVTVNVNIAGNLIGNNEFIQSLKNMLALELKTAMAAV